MYTRTRVVSAYFVANLWLLLHTLLLKCISGFIGSELSKCSVCLITLQNVYNVFLYNTVTKKLKVHIDTLDCAMCESR